MIDTRILQPLIALALAMKYGAIALFLASLIQAYGTLAASAQSAPDACTGVNLVADLEKSDPQAFAELQAEADARWQNGEAKFWKIEKDGLETSYLFGTAHLTDPRVTQLSPAAEEAFNASDRVIVELVDIKESAQAVFADANMREDLFFTDGSTLEAYLTDDQVEALKNRINGGSTPWFLAKRMKPWLVLGLLAPSKCEVERQVSGEVILDQQLVERARAADKTAIGLETAREQFEALASLDFDVQIEALSEIVLSFDILDDMNSTLIELYLDGDIGLIWPMLTAFSPEGDDDESVRTEFERKIVIDRNIRMAERSEPLLELGASFIAVGALHLPGEEGLVSLFRDRGYTVTALE
jgi:hypothetical protein